MAAARRRGIVDGRLSVPLLHEALGPFLRQATPPRRSRHDRPAWATWKTVFSYATRPAPLDARSSLVATAGGLSIEAVRYATGPLTRASAYVVRPAGDGPFPAVLLFHCHSGVYRWGKEKVVARAADPADLLAFRDRAYAGRSLAHDLARAGFLVLVPDAFYFGARAVGRPSGRAGRASLEAARRSSEELVARMLLLSGHSWPAVMAWEDRRALDYLWTRRDVRKGRVGCLGLSLGGLRALLLAAQDTRIRAAVSAGWLTTASDVLTGKAARHSWMVLIPGASPTFDYPDLAARIAPDPLLALLCERDHLFTRAGMEAAARRLRAAFRAAGSGGVFVARRHRTPHRFTAGMQREALVFLKRHLRTPRAAASPGPSA